MTSHRARDALLAQAAVLRTNNASPSTGELNGVSGCDTALCFSRRIPPPQTCIRPPTPFLARFHMGFAESQQQLQTLLAGLHPGGLRDDSPNRLEPDQD